MLAERDLPPGKQSFPLQHEGHEDAPPHQEVEEQSLNFLVMRRIEISQLVPRRGGGEGGERRGDLVQVRGGVAEEGEVGVDGRGRRGGAHRDVCWMGGLSPAKVGPPLSCNGMGVESGRRGATGREGWQGKGSSEIR